jgi:hypothetical protein
MARGLSFPALVLFFATFVSLSLGWDINSQNDRHSCQAHSRDPLEGCDRKRTVYVDVVSNNSQYKTVQSGKFLPPSVNLVVS